MQKAPNYLNPEIPAGLERVRIPVVEATPENLEGYGYLLDSPDQIDIEIKRRI